MGEPQDIPRRGLHFSPVIELGHILQAVVMLVMVGGWAIVGYEAIQTQINAEVAQEKMLQQRIENDEKVVLELREEMRSTASDQRVLLGKVIDQISDIRASVSALGAKDGGRR